MVYFIVCILFALFGLFIKLCVVIRFLFKTSSGSYLQLSLKIFN